MASRKVGESLQCASCGHEYASEAAVQFKGLPKPKVFDASDAARKIEVFRESEKGRFLPLLQTLHRQSFTQRCDLHKKEVEATDFCLEFERKPTPRWRKRPRSRAEVSNGCSHRSNPEPAQP